MKLNFKKEVRSKEQGARNPGNGFSSSSLLLASPGKRGIALVITLILLSVTLFMAIAFLAISRRERGSVTTSTDTATARLAADSALANAQAQIIANIFATTNPYDSSLVVSTNYVNQNGFVGGIANPTNVNYDFVNGGGTYTVGDFEQNVANLFLSPRAPVFVTTNQQTGASEFRFYLDLNRNGNFESNYFGQDIDNNGNLIAGNSYLHVGDPEWIGVLERPDVPHGPNNKFLSRYAFIAVPADSLDWNYIHNQAKTETVNHNPTSNVSDGFIRNQGVGSWEINLAAFLTDLNVNQWDTTAASYEYLQPAFPNSGFAFQDALSLLSYRYNFNYNSLAFASALFANGALGLQNEPMDIYPFGPLMTSTAVPFYPNLAANSWAGADNTNHFFDLTADLFDPTKSSGGTTGGFTNRLLNAGAGVSTYDRYTYYRLLAQLGTDSLPETGKMNLNYDNLDPYIYTLGANTFTNPPSATNLLAWTPIGFFTNAADRMLRIYTTNWFQANPSNYLATHYGLTNFNYFYFNGFSNVLNDPSGLGLTNEPFFGMTNQIPAFGIGNIPVYVNGQYVYSSAVQRVLQLAANMYDATTNRFYDSVFNTNTIPLPTLFEPVFYTNGIGSLNVYITNYVEYTGLGSTLTNTFPLDLDNPNDLARVQPFSSIYGVPIIVGAKKGLPNFNEFAMQSAFQITRKLQLTRSSADTNVAPISSYKINQIFNCSISNLLSVECWNSYFSNYTRPTTIWVADHIQMVLTNDQPANPQLWPVLDATLSASITTNNWPGIGANMNAGSFLITNLTAIALPTATYIFNNPLYFIGAQGYHFRPVTNSAAVLNYEALGGSPPFLPQPHWGLITTNNLQVVLIDNTTGRAIDYVQLHGPITSRDLTAQILGETNNAAMWQTNFVSSGPLQGQSLPGGVEDQLDSSESGRAFSPLTTSDKSGIDGFLVFIGAAPIFNTPNSTNGVDATNLEIQVAYTPTATAVQTTTLQANDPLVHYLASDLFDSAQGNGLADAPVSPLITPTPNERYQPWGVSSQMGKVTRGPDGTPFNPALKDPLIWNSDHWDFPANPFPTVGWLGRVHRGTPWQTVYLKASNFLKTSGTNLWMNWTGDFDVNDAASTAPVQDRLLFDVFTTALNDNATRGRLSVNVAANPNDPVAGLAAWSALFSGVMALSNSIPDLGNPGMNLIAAAGLVLQKQKIPLPPAYTLSSTAFPIDPVGANGANSSLQQIVVNINSARTNFVNLDGANNAFEHVGDILSAPQLTEQSPLLHWKNGTINDTAQQEYGISDEMYEWLPQQTMSLLTVSSTPRYVIYSYGQTLKPAPNGITTDGSTAFFGMVTNYQVVSEIATRAVVRVNTVLTTNSDGTVTPNYSTTVEQFNILPPD